MNKRECDGCFACCVALAIPELDKERLTPCINLADHPANGMQCGIYEDRPETCRNFECAWLQDNSLGTDADRPDKTGLIVTFQKAEHHDVVTMLVFEFRENAHQTQEGRRYISYLEQQVKRLRTTMVVALTDGRCQIFGNEDDIKRIWPEQAPLNGKIIT